MSRTNVKKNRSNRVSVFNWIGTLLLSAIPGVNIIAWILMIVLCKRQAKRSFAIAALILVFLGIALYIAAFMFFGDQLVEFAKELLPAATVAPMPVP